MGKKVIFGGDYGIRSYGDDAPLVVMSNLLKQRIPDISCVVVSRHPKENHYAAHGIRAIPGLEYPSRKESKGKWLRGFNPGENISDLCALYEEIRSSDLLILGAGNFLVDYTIDIIKGPIPRFIILSLMAKMAGTPVMWFGISVGPFRTPMGKNFSRLAALLADSITLRDEKSLRELSGIGIRKNVTVLPDAAYGLPLPASSREKNIPAWNKAHGESTPVIAIAARTLPANSSIDNDTYTDVLSKTCDLLVSSMNCHILFIPQCTYSHGVSEEDDRNIAQIIIKKMKHPSRAFSVQETITLEDCISLYKESAAAICTRLHGCVFAAMQGVPVTGINYNPKVYEFFRWLGCEDNVIDLADLKPEKISTRVKEMITQKPEYKLKYANKFQNVQNELEKYATIAINAMENKVNYEISDSKIL